jgi:hypothetical protein
MYDRGMTVVVIAAGEGVATVDVVLTEGRGDSGGFVGGRITGDGGCEGPVVV